MATYDDFWGRAGPGLLDFGMGAYNKRAAQKEAQRRLAASRGPVYDQSTDAASKLLGEFGMLDADALAGDRFAAQEGLLAGPQAKDEADLMRMLHAKGMLGVSNFNPGVEGITPDGTAMNPHMAAFYAARNADRSKRALGSLDEGQKFASGMVDRAGALQRVGGNAQETGFRADDRIPSKSAANAGMLKGAIDIFRQNPGILKDIWGGVSGLFGGGGYGFGGFANPDEFSIW
jgi:hypothetical protein